MDIYSVLGVTKDASIDDIRLAYSTKLKTIDMSKNIEEYQNLRLAYNEALKIVNNQYYNPINKVTSELNNTETKVEKINSTDISTLLSNAEEEKDRKSVRTINQPTNPEKEITTNLRRNERKKVDNSIKKEQPITTKKESFTHDLSLFLAENTYFSSSSDWHSLISPVLSTNEKESALTTIKVFLLENYMLLDDRTRHEIINLCQFSESSFNSTEDIVTFRERINQENFLDYDCYAFMPSGIREDYFKLRYQLHQSIQVADIPVLLSEIKMNQLVGYPYKDDDLLFLLSVSSLLNQTKLNNPEINNYLSKIHSDKYIHDIKILKKYASFLDNDTQIIISNAEIIGLTWVSDGTKEQLIAGIRQTKQNKKIIKSAKRSLPYQPNIESKSHVPFNIWKGIAIFIVILISSLFVISIISPNNEEVDFENSLEVNNQENNEIDYFLKARPNNIRLNYELYDNLFWENSDSSEPPNGFTSESFNQVSKIKENYRNDLENMDQIDIYSEASEAHFLTENNTVISYVSFRNNEDFNLKVTVDAKNIINQVQVINSTEMPKNKSFGTLDASLFLFEDIAMKHNRLDDYKSDLEQLYSLYLTEDCYDLLLSMDDEAFNYLGSFSYTKPYLLTIKEQTIIVFAGYSDQLIFMDLDDNFKISHLYADYFEETPNEYLEAVKKLKINKEDSNPWAISLGN
ncbi:MULTISPECIES: hypothetical protein [Vagococcus]|uniref:J domain-containing protein n=1 Tax=Vagococcus fluvialis bH819 TaxID=1255619 RepID=A0A1X6WKB5_9ENTE|nr:MULTISPECIES: hypothetical protein [Vagococcus]SLM84773.1 hypothetical protein FM121_01675 [Vagococcus fluvialis bH819]HCM89767.1 hypothetical protein [Vagococcus sp.]